MNNPNLQFVKLPSQKKDEQKISSRHQLMYPHFGFWGTFQFIILLAAVTATIFTMWTPANLFSNQLLDRMLLALQVNEKPQEAHPAVPVPTASSRPKIGIVSGHWQYDSGAVCEDGLSEMQVNLRIATLVRQQLILEGYEVDLLSEFDDKLHHYEALALVSIHNDSCQYINDDATGFKVASAAASASAGKASRLLDCMVYHYQNETGLQFHHNTITPDMTSYHAFEEIDDNTPAIIIEAGFLNLDRSILTEHPDTIANGIAKGILCFARDETIPTFDITPTP